MKFTTLLSSALLAVPILANSPFPWERLNKNDSLLIIVDLQEGLYTLARDYDPTLYKQNMLAHSALGLAFPSLPVILTTSASTGPNGPLPQEILDMYPTAPLISRQGEVNAWDSPEFRAAVKATGKKQIILAGIVTDVCTAFLARSLRAEGYSVWANQEASGTVTKEIRDLANDQMMRAGVNVVSLFSIVCDLMRDWRSSPGAKEILPWLDRYMPAYGLLARGHRAAVENGTVIPGEADLPL
ncbi:Isochorismatase hydrolase [Apiosordaria backusii]|uniref:Isochorismatase hydrolase n=1 Tax=Apiosordaria backusii TaxID=314023 RepID=A0AA40BMF5_9PEZI|nr:Isochorismatase hydrolase [Apiosordaria backusii]